MKKLFIILYLLTNIFVLGACGDVESEGDPQPRVPRVEVESDDYYTGKYGWGCFCLPLAGYRNSIEVCYDFRTAGRWRNN